MKKHDMSPAQIAAAFDVFDRMKTIGDRFAACPERLGRGEGAHPSMNAALIAQMRAEIMCDMGIVPSDRPPGGSCPADALIAGQTIVPDDLRRRLLRRNGLPLGPAEPDRDRLGSAATGRVVVDTLVAFVTGKIDGAALAMTEAPDEDLVQERGEQVLPGRILRALGEVGGALLECQLGKSRIRACILDFPRLDPGLFQHRRLGGDVGV
ncbi:hypothetical protein [Defluviimonas salinarum]|uniref:Uncharacterized protein n=1 Tax=Defluviimonas salinarum TaxID=2992147 RepID=A0ABT3J891_9RHOB|nr:hypothetical protein [Defluviimonas salinarum]MCW3783908.1 hypothetical protein [Defluviimonas salinarum]